MPRIPKNKLTIEPVKNGFRMFGYISGKKIRVRSPYRVELEAMKMKLEAGARILPADAAKVAWITQIQMEVAQIEDRLFSIRKLLEHTP